MFTREELLKHYETMVKIRKFDLEAKRAREAGEILGNVHVYVGEEAVATGVCACLERKDYIESTHRGHGHTIAKGAELNPMMAELYGKATGSCKGKGGRSISRISALVCWGCKRYRRRRLRPCGRCGISGSLSKEPARSLSCSSVTAHPTEARSMRRPTWRRHGICR